MNPFDKYKQPMTPVAPQQQPGEDQGSDFVRGLGAGWEETKAMGSGLAMLAGDLIGSEGLSEWGEEGYREGMASAGEYAPPEQASKIEDIDSVGEFFDWGQYQLGKLMPMVATSLVSGGVGGIAAKGLAGAGLKGTAQIAARKAAQGQVLKGAEKVALKKMGTRATVGAGVGTAASSIGMETGLIAGDIKERTGESDPMTALMYGSAAGLLDVLPQFRILNKLGLGEVAEQGAKKLTRGQLARKVGKEIGIQAGVEGATEAGQEVLEEAAVWDSLGEDLTSPEALKNIFDKSRLMNAAAVGALGGGILGGGTKAFTELGKQGQIAKQEQAKRELTGEGQVFSGQEGGTEEEQIKARTKAAMEEAGLESKLTPYQKEELEAKLEVIRDEQDMQEDYGISSKEVEELIGAVRNGDAIPQQRLDMLITEMENSVTNMEDMANGNPAARGELRKLRDGIKRLEGMKEAGLESRTPGFYSAVEKGAKNLKQKKGTAEQMLNMLRKEKNVKQDEVSALGLEEWMQMEEEKEGTVSKERVEEFVKGGGVQVEEKILEEMDEEEKIEIIQEREAQLMEEAYNEARLDKENELDREMTYEEEEEFTDTFYDYQNGELFELARDQLEGELASTAQYDDYQMEGDKKGYKELLLKLPTAEKDKIIAADKKLMEDFITKIKAKYKVGSLVDMHSRMNEQERAEYQRIQVGTKLPDEFTGQHFEDNKNILAHVRFNEREVDGKKTLFIEEFQSDWAQEGREKGFKQEQAKELKPELTGLAGIERQRTDAVPAAPFISTTKKASFAKAKDEQGKPVYDVFYGKEDGKLKKHSTVTKRAEARALIKKLNAQGELQDNTEGWSMLAMKRMIQYATDNGFEQVAWTPGEVQNKRYRLSQQIKEVNYRPDSGFFTAITHDDNIAVNRHMSMDEVEENIGKEPTDKLKERIAEYERQWDQYEIVESTEETANLEYNITDPNGEFLYDQGGTLEAFATKQEAKEHLARMQEADAINNRNFPRLTGLDLDIGGEGMKGFYDKMLPSNVGKYLKSQGYDSKIGVSKAKIGTEDVQAQNNFVLKEGQDPAEHGFVEVLPGDILPLAMAKRHGHSIAFPGPDNTWVADAIPARRDNAYRERVLEKGRVFKPLQEDNMQEVWSFPLSQETAQKVQAEGAPLFSEKQDNAQGKGPVWDALKDSLGQRPLKRAVDAGIVNVLSKEEFETRFKRNPSEVQGLFQNGKVYVHEGTLNPSAVILHEGTHSSVDGKQGEAGLQLLLGTSYMPLQRQFDRLVKDGDSVAVEAASRARKGRMAQEKRNPDFTPDKLAHIELQERLAYYTELSAEANTPLFKRIVAQVKAWIRQSDFGKQLAKHGISFKLDNATIVELAKMSMGRTTAVEEFKNKVTEEGVAEIAKRKAKSKGQQEEGLESFAGVLAEKTSQPLFDYTVAEKLLNRGEAADEVRKATGWFKLQDNKWRFEIPDNEAKLKTENIQENYDMKLGSVLTHDKLFAAYPELRRYNFELVDFEKKKNGEYDPNTKTIRVNSRLNEEERLSTLLHEIQHGIQHIEGFAQGGSPENFFYTIPELQSVKVFLNAMDVAGVKKDFDRAHTDVYDDLNRFANIYKPSKDKMDSFVTPQEWQRLKSKGITVEQDRQWREVWQGLAQEAVTEVEQDSANTPMGKYNKLLGETEAREVQDRQYMDSKTRRLLRPSMLGKPKDDYLIKMGGMIVEERKGEEKKTRVEEKASSTSLESFRGEIEEDKLTTEIKEMGESKRFNVEQTGKFDTKAEFTISPSETKKLEFVMGSIFTDTEGNVSTNSPLYYDPTLTEIKKSTSTDEYGTFKRQVPLLKEGTGLVDRIPSKKRDGIIWRGMSSDEYEGIQENGFIKSRSLWNIGPEQAQTTSFGVDPRTAEFYANGFAPAQFKAMPGYNAYIVGIKDPGNSLEIAGNNEKDIPGKISAEDIVEVWEGVPYAVRPGTYETIREPWDKEFTSGSSNGITSMVGWKQIRGEEGVLESRVQTEEEASPSTQASPTSLESLFANDSTDVWGETIPGFAGETASKQDKFLYRFQDRLRYLYTKQKKVLEAKGERQLPDEQDAYLQETLYHGRVKTRLENFHTNTRDPMLNLIKKMGRKIDGKNGIDRWLLARHAEEANERLRRINAKKYLREILPKLPQDQRRRINTEISALKQRIKDGQAQGNVPAVGPAMSAFDRSEGYETILNNELGRMPEQFRHSWKRFTLHPSGMKDSTAREILRKNAGDQRIQEIGRMFDAMNRQSLKNRHDAGLMTDEEYDAIAGAYQHWAPLKREGFEDKLGSKGQGYAIAGNEFMVRAGSTSHVIDVLANAIAANELGVIRAEKQKIGEALYNMVKANPDPSFWRVNKEDEVPTVDADGSIRTYKSERNEAYEVRVKIKGKRHRIRFEPTNENAYRIAHGLKNLDNSGGAIVGGLSAVNRVLSFVNTSASPEFMVSNLIRDLQTAQFNMSDTEAGQFRGRILKDVLGAGLGIRSALRSRNASGNWVDWYKDFAKEGGTTGWVDNYNSIEHVRTKLNRQISRMKTGSPLNVFSNVVDTISDYNTAVENAVRLATYKNLVDSGTMTKQRAAQVAKELTVNFNRKGASGQLVNALYLFANAGIQGSMRIFRAARYSNKVRAMMVGTIGASVGLAAANRELGGDDEDGENYYDKIPEWVKERNMIFMIPDSKGDYVKVPLPWGYNVLWVMGDQIAAAGGGFAGENPEYKAMDSASTIVKAMLGAFSPVQGGTLLQSISPTIADPVAMWAENKTFTGANLQPTKNPFDKVPTPAHQNFFKTARPTSQKISKFMSDISFGDDVEGGFVDVSPEVLDLAWDTVLGSAGRFLADTSNLGVQTAQGDLEDVEAKRTPFLRRVYGAANNSVDQQLYKERVTEIYTAEKKKELSRGQADYGEVVQETRGLLRLKGKVKATEKRIKQLRKLKRSARTEERKEAIQRRMERLMSKFNLQYRRMLAQGLL